MQMMILLDLYYEIKYFDNGGKNMSFKTEYDSVLVKYSDIWNKILKTLGMKFHSKPLYYEKYIKAKVETSFNSVVNTVFWSNEIPKEREHYTCISAINIDSATKMDKKN